MMGHRSQKIDALTAWADVVARAVARIAFAFKADPQLLVVTVYRSPKGLLSVRPADAAPPNTEGTKLVGTYRSDVTLRALLDDLEATIAEGPVPLTFLPAREVD